MHNGNSLNCEASLTIEHNFYTGYNILKHFKNMQYRLYTYRQDMELNTNV